MARKRRNSGPSAMPSSVASRRTRSLFVFITLSFLSTIFLYLCLTKWPFWGTTNPPTSAPPSGKLTDQEIRALVSSYGPSEHGDFNRTLSKIMIPRVSGTAGNERVRKHIVDYLKDLDWDVQVHTFTDQTPIGVLGFGNIIATLNPRACRQVVLSCHYDSKYFPSFDFLGATDSAVPCAMLLELVRSLKQPLQRFAESNDLSLQLMFFDGEEAFRQWTETDSLYGSRRLATKLSQDVFSRSEECFGSRNKASREIDRIDLLVLLDLIGEANPSFCNHFSNTKHVYDKLATIEKRLNRLKLLTSRRATRYFVGDCLFSSGVDDDHVPFMRKNVKVLHIIATPFPNVWHTPDDNAQAIHHPTVHNLMTIFKVFLVEHLQLKV